VRAELVSEASLAPIGRQLGLGGYLRLGRGEERSGGREKASLLADALEAVLGAVYRDGGLAAAQAVVEALLGAMLERAVLDQAGSDHKTRLQERLQARGAAPPTYVLVEAEGPEHRKTYSVEVRCDGETIGQGQGRSKKAAQQAAARLALQRLDG
jgi:ribonuclease-3